MVSVIMLSVTELRRHGVTASQRHGVTKTTEFRIIRLIMFSGWPEDGRDLVEDDLLEGVIEETVEHRIGYRRHHSEEERQGIADGYDDAPFRKYLGNELVEEGVEDEGAPADEEDGGDAAEKDVGSSPALVHLWGRCYKTVYSCHLWMFIIV